MTSRNRHTTSDIDILRSPDFDVVELAVQHKKVQEALRRDFPWTMRLAYCLPLGLRDEAHTASRRRLAQIVSKRRPILKNMTQDLVQQKLAMLKTSGRYDILNDGLVPLVDTFMGELTQMKIDPEATCLTSRIFDPACSPATRVRLDRAAELVFFNAMEKYPDATPDEIDTRVALVVMGRDALLGALAASLHVFLSRSKGAPINAEVFPISPLGTGVPYVWRQNVHAEEEVFEFRLDTLCDQDDMERMKMYGIGAHSCLGKILSVDIFLAIKTFLAQLPTTVTDCELELMKNHVLNVPSKMEVEVS